jgi:hypothetical protein
VLPDAGAEIIASLKARVTELERLCESMRAEMDEAVQAYHGKAVLFSARFLKMAERG